MRSMCKRIRRASESRSCRRLCRTTRKSSIRFSTNRRQMPIESLGQDNLVPLQLPWWPPGRHDPQQAHREKINCFVFSQNWLGNEPVKMRWWCNEPFFGI